MQLAGDLLVEQNDANVVGQKELKKPAQNMASADVIEPFRTNNAIFDAEIDDLEGAQNGVPDSLNENPTIPAKEETLFTKDDIFDDESSLQSSLDCNESSREVQNSDLEASKLVVEETNISAAQEEPALDKHDLFDDERSVQNSCDSHNEEDEETETLRRDPTQNQRSPKPRRLKKAAIQSIHSECQKMLRESVVKLPYHQPSVKPITDFLKRVPAVTARDNKQFQKKVVKNSSIEQESDAISNTQPSDITNNDEATTTPKLSCANDPFFLDETPTEKLPTRGIQSLMQRFAKHTRKPESKSKNISKANETVGNDKQSSDNSPLIVKERIEKATPGERLKILKEQLESKMKLQRAELRKIHESQRKLDNEEMSGEEEEEEEEEMTDEESESDGELDKWNEDDEKKQEEVEDDDYASVERRNEFIDGEADEDDDSKGSFDEINSGSDGDVSDEGNSDDDNDNNSVFSDDEALKQKKHHKVRKYKKAKENSHGNHDEGTLDLFNFNSNSQGSSEDSKTCNKVAETSKNEEDTEQELCLRLESIEEDEEGSQSCTKTKDFKSPTSMKLSSTMEESSQSSLSFQTASDPDGTNESSKIQPAQRGGNSKPVASDSESSEFLSMFPKISKHINRNQKTTETSNKKAGKLSQLSLPIEDSQDLFYDESTEDNEEEKAQEQVTISNNFSFALDEDTQFTQMLDTQGFLFSTSKPKSKPKSFFNEGSEKSTQEMEEIIGLCSGNFSGQDSIPEKQAKKPHSLGINNVGDHDKSTNMDELLGLCSGQFSSNQVTEERTNARKLKPRSLLGTAIEAESSSHIDELLDLCSGVFPSDQQQDTQSKKDMGNSDTSINLDTTATEEDKASDSNDNKEGGDDSDLEAENAENSDDDQEDLSVKDDKSGGEEEDSDADFEAMRKNKKYQKMYGKSKKIFDKKKFYEEEAELSGSDVGSDEDEDIDTDEDVIEEDSDQEELPSDEELQKQINKVHMKSVLDQDKAELRMVQDMYLPDGDLHGEGRKRNFRWRGIDSNSQFDLFDNKIWNDDDNGAIELLTEEECKRRKERFERDTFMREEMSKANQQNIEDMDENSQVILNIIKDTSNASPALTKPVEKQQQAKVKPATPVPRLQRIPSQKGSFLNRSKATLSRLSSITANTPNTSSSGRTFVFKAVEETDKAKTENSKKMRRTASVNEPSTKRPKLDRSLSDTSDSIFAML